MAKEIDWSKFLVGGIIILVIFLIGTYIVNSFMADKIISGGPVLFFVFTGIVMTVAIYLLRSTKESNLDVGKTAILLLVGGAMIYFIIKFAPNIIPSSFSILANKALPLLLLIPNQNFDQRKMEVKSE